MNQLTAKSRITIGLACMLVSVLSAATLIGMVPEPNSAILDGRGSLCEAIAVCSSDYISRGELRRLEFYLQSVIQRHGDILSAGVRRSDGVLVTQIGNHETLWKEKSARRSNETHVLVPLRAGAKKWGAVELRFSPVAKTGPMRWVSSPWLRLIVFVTAGSYLLFFIYLGRMLEHLDPSKTVPRRVRAALDSLAEGLLVIDREDRIVLANQAFANWIRRSPEKLVGVKASGTPWFTDVAGQPLAGYPWKDALELETPQSGVMLGLNNKHQKIRIVMANASPVLGHDGKYRGVLVSFDDVTQLEETKKDLSQAKQAAEDANQAKSAFLARMSHEIRTPMNAILGYTDVLRRGFDQSAQDRQDYLETIHASGEHLLTLINDILDLSKIEAGKMDLEMQHCSPHQILKQVVSVLRGKAQEKNIFLKFECRGSLPETILTDPIRLRQTVLNLAGNAIKFTNQGGVRIVARLARTNESGNTESKLVIDIIDTGIGIAPEAQRKIFDPFAQADSSVTRRFGGTGLGLAISRQLAVAMGGGIAVSSVARQGSTFTLTINTGSLEGVALVDGKTIQDRVAAKPSAPQSTQLPPGRVLVADDGESNRKLVNLVLSRAGVEVVMVENGAEAVDQALQSPFDVIFMDMQMPVMDGYTAAATLRQNGYERPIVALTAHAMRGDEDKCRAAGCSGFLTKPINIDTLLETVANLLQDSQLEPLHDPPLNPPETDLDANQLTSRSAPDDDAPIFCTLPVEDAEFLEIAEEFTQRLEMKLEAMRQACDRGDYDELATLAHWLKGAGGTAGFDVLSQLALRLEQAAKSRRQGPSTALVREISSLEKRIKLPVSSN